MSPHNSSAPPLMPSTVVISLRAAVIKKGDSETGVLLLNCP
jgi:hypothetical protein